MFARLGKQPLFVAVDCSMTTQIKIRLFSDSVKQHTKCSEKHHFERFLFDLFHATVKAFEINQRSSLWKSGKDI